MVNPFEKSGKWFKANFHVHTTTSDGKLSACEVVKKYRSAGYNVLAITDHRKTNDVSGMSNKKMLVISGMEYHPSCPGKPVPYHIVGLNIPHGFEFDEPDNVLRCVRQIKKIGGESILAHPYWSGQAYEDFKKLLNKIIAVEVYNATCNRHGRPCSENEWVYCLDRGRSLPCIGNDDAHFVPGDDVFGCWTWLKMRSLTVKNVINAIKTGCCYVSCGPTIKDFRLKNGEVHIRCSPVSTIYFTGDPGRGFRKCATGKKLAASFSIEIPPWNYVRAVVVDVNGRRAWTNPIFLK